MNDISYTKPLKDDPPDTIELQHAHMAHDHLNEALRFLSHVDSDNKDIRDLADIRHARMKIHSAIRGLEDLYKKGKV